MKDSIKGYLYFIKLFAVIAILILLAVNFGPFKDLYYHVLAGIEPHLHERLEREFAAKTNEYLIRKLNSWSQEERGYASDELEKRSDKTMLPLFLKMMKSGNKNEKDVAISVLVKLNEPVVIPVLLDMVDKKKDFWSYNRGVQSLALMRYEPIIPEIRKLADMPKTKEYGDIPRSNAVESCKMFGNNPKTIEILKIIANYKDTIFAADDAREALERITGKPYKPKS